MRSIISGVLILALAFAISAPVCAAPKSEGLRGTGQVYYASIPDQIATTGNITTATTTQLIAPVGNQAIFLFWMGFQSSSSLNSSTINFEYSPIAGCASSATFILPTGYPISSAFTSGSVFSVFSAVGIQGTVGSGVISTGNMPYVIQPGNYVCVVSTGTTIGYYGIAAYAQHV